MAVDIKQRVSELLDSVAEAYIEDQKEKNIRNTGASAGSIRKSFSAAGGDLRGVGYFHQQRHGRKPGKFMPPERALEYVMSRGITPRDPKTSLKSLAYMINRKIAEKGTDIFQGKRPGLNVDEKIKELVQEFKRQVAEDRMAEMKELLKA